MSPKKRWLISIASFALCTACAFGWREYQQIQEVEKRISFFQEWSKLDFSIPPIPERKPHE